METDDERREVARRLRELEVCEFDGEFIDCGEVENALGLVSDDGAWYGAEGVTRLADLIEPSGHECVPGKCPLNVRHDNDRIDQERLMAIATMMAADSVRSAKQGISVSPVYILHAARDIAEACGETFGSIRNRELAKWGTSIVPKETTCDLVPSGWTSFDERLPERGAPVLCKGKNGAYYVGKPVTFNGERTDKVWVPRGAEYRSPAAWRPVDSPTCEK